MRRKFLLLSRNAFLQNSLVVFIGTMMGSVLNYVFHLMIGRTVDAQMYGEIESLIALFAIISVPAAALTMIATKYAAGMRAEGNIPGTQALTRYLNRKVLLYGTPLFLVALLLTPLVNNFLNIDNSLPVLFLWCIMFLSFLSAAASGILTGWQKFGGTNVAGVLSSVLKLLLAFIFIRIGWGVGGVMGSYVLSLVAAYALYLYFLRKLLAKSQSEEIPQTPAFSASLKRYVLPAFYGTLAIAILGNADMVFAKHHLDPVSSGEYGALTVIAKTIFFATSVITTVLFAMAAEESHRGEATRTFHMATLLTLLLAGGSILLFFMFPEWVMRLFFGEKYVGVSSLLGWFGVIAGVYSLGNLFLQYLLSIHETRIAAIFLALSSLEVLMLFLWGGGVYAIIAITIFAQILAVGLGCFFIWKKKVHGPLDLPRYTDL